MTDADRNFDVIVIGSGPGGYVAAIRAAQLGLRAACVEYEELGGVCLNVGCIPTKALLSSALLVGQLGKAGQHGIKLGEMEVALGPAQKRSRGVASRLVRGIHHLFKKNGVTHIEGRGRLVGGGAVEVRNGDGEAQRFHGRNVIIATGSRPRDIPVLTIDGERVWSSTHALFQKEAPGHLVVVGAGAVGIEFADIYAAYGSKVTVVEMLDRILPVEDEEVSEVVAKSYRRRGMEILTGTSLLSTETRDDGVRLTVRDGDGEERALEADYVLSAVGRVPNTEDIGLEEAGVATTDGGFVDVNEHMETSVPGIFAIGDCAGPPLLAHKGSHEGIVAVEHLAGVGHGGVDYANIPNCTYCHPEVASVGLTEAQAREAGHDIEVGRFPWMGNGRALAAGDSEGFVKVIRDTRYSEILGAHIVGPGATELIAEFVVGRHLEATVEEMEKAMHPHPTLSEAVAEAALSALGRAIHI